MLLCTPDTYEDVSPEFQYSRYPWLHRQNGILASQVRLHATALGNTEQNLFTQLFLEKVCAF